MKKNNNYKNVELNKKDKYLKKIIFWICWGLVFFLVVGIVVFLIYKIPKELKSLQKILTTVFAAIFGGMLTLIGVIITIKKGDRSRLEDEKSKHIPYLALIKNEKEYDVQQDHVLERGFGTRINKNINNVGDITLKYSYVFDDIFIKNISYSCIVLKGILINNYYIEFINNQLLEVGAKAKIKGEELKHTTYEEEVKVKLFVCDSLRNEYYFDIEIELIGGKTVFYKERKDYPLTEYKCLSKQISLPHSM